MALGPLCLDKGSFNSKDLIILRENLYGCREGWREKISRQLFAELEPIAPSQDAEITTYVKIRSLMLKWLSHPGAPSYPHFKGEHTGGVYVD